MKANGQAVAETLRKLIVEYYTPPLQDQINSLKKDLAVVLDRLEVIENKVGENPRQEIRIELDDLERRMKLLKKEIR